MEAKNNNLFESIVDDTFDFKKEVSRYFSYWPIFLVSMFVTFVVAYSYLRLAPRVYSSTAKIKILDKSDGLELPTAGFVFNRSNINLENEIEILQSYPILKKVVERLNANVQFFQVGTVRTSQLYKLPFDFQLINNNGDFNESKEFFIDVKKNHFLVFSEDGSINVRIEGHNSYAINHDFPFELKILSKSDLSKILDKQFKIVIKPLKNAVINFKKSLSISAVSKSSDLISLNLNGEDKILLEFLLNTLVDVFNKDGINDRQLVSQRTMEFIDERFVYLSRELDSIEIAYQDFKERNKLSNISSDLELGLQKQSQIETDLFKIDNQIELVKLLFTNINNSSSGELLPVDIGINNTAVNTLIVDYNDAIVKLNKFDRSGGENNPALQFMSSQINDLYNNIKTSLNSHLSQLNESKRQLTLRSNQFSGNISQIPEKERLLKSIARQQQIKESLYLLLLQKREEAAINLAITEPSIKIVENAMSSGTPISPNSLFVYLIALVGSLALPFGVLYLIFFLDTKIHDREDFERISSDVPILAEIPQIKKGGSLLFTDPNATSVLAESFRILSANVNFLIPKMSNNLGKIIYCTSTIKGEGKTFVSLNLSLALSSLNKKVLLIGADMRNPQIHTYFGTSKNQLGLSSYLNDQSANWKELLMSGFDEHPEHRTMLSGAIPPNPAHLLTNGRFEQLLTEVRTEFDYVIVDTAPTILVTDTLLISKFADITLFLTKANYTDKKLLKFSKDLSDSKKITNMAYVINSVGAGKSYGYGYGYNYGYSYGYHEEN